MKTLKRKLTVRSDARTKSESPGAGHNMGVDGAKYIIDAAEGFRSQEAQRLAALNKANITAHQTQLGHLKERKRRIEVDLADAKRNPDAKRARSKRIFHYVVAAILMLCGYFFARLTFAPFGFGLTGELFCLGLAVVGAVTTDYLLNEIPSRWLRTGLKVLAFGAAVTALILLAQVRGDILAQSFRDAGAPAVVIDGHPAQATDDSSGGFYAHNRGRLSIALALLALAMELASGLAFHVGNLLGDASFDSATELENQLKKVEAEIADHEFAIASLEQESEAFRAQFGRDFYGAAIKHLDSAKGKLTMLLVVILLTGGIAKAQEKRNQPCEVIAVDLTGSENRKGPDGKSGLQQNLDATAQLLAQMPAGGHITVIGITSTSFTEPYILLSAEVGSNAGFFGERLAGARRSLTAEWATRRRTLKTGFNDTDILGALLLAGQLFSDGHCSDKHLTILSDMRHRTRELDLESTGVINVEQALKQARALPLPQLAGVDVDILGANATGKSTLYWDDLRQFWSHYLAVTGSSVRRFSPLANISTTANLPAHQS